METLTSTVVTSQPVDAMKSGVQSALNLCFDRWKSFVTFAHPYVDTAKEKLEKAVTCVAFPGCESVYNRSEALWQSGWESVKEFDEKYNVKTNALDAVSKFFNLVWLPLTLALNLKDQLWTKSAELKDNVAPTAEHYWGKVGKERREQLSKLYNGATDLAKQGYDTISYEVNGLRKGELGAKDVWNDSIGGFANVLNVGLDQFGHEGYYAFILTKLQVFKLLQKVKFSDPDNTKKLE